MLYINICQPEKQTRCVSFVFCIIPNHFPMDIVPSGLFVYVYNNIYTGVSSSANADLNGVLINKE